MGSGIFQTFMNGLSGFAANVLLPTLFIVCFVHLVLRALVHYTVKREDWFARELEKRVTKFLEQDQAKVQSFYVACKMLLEKTYYELFEMRGIMKRRKLDYITEPSDRVFLIQHGSACFVKDTLKEVRHLRYGEERPKFLEIAKSVIQNNACFSRLFGMIPVGPLNDVLNILPGLFIVGGIFGTFIGIMESLPTLGDMDVTNPDQTKLVMDQFLLNISFAMATSVCGILLSVTTTIYNAILNPERLFVSVVNRLDSTLIRLWNRCQNNELPENMAEFDEHRDPLEALASLSVEKEVANKKPGTHLPPPPRGTSSAETDQEVKRKAS